MWLAWLLFGGLCLLFAVAYLTLVLLTPHPRPAFSSECVYSTHNATDLPLPSLSDPASVHFTLVVPAYNESSRLPSMLNEALDHLEQRGKSYEVIVVDDGSSTGDTAKAALDCARQRLGRGGEHLRLVRLKQNRGKGGAVAHGMLFARGQLLLFADADGASQFSDLDNLESALELLQKDADSDHHQGLVLGSRAHMVDTEAVVKRSFLRNLLMRAFHFYLHVLGISSIKDTQCGFKLCTRETARIIYPSMHVEGWIFDVELITIALLAGVPIAEVPITWREVEGSKMSLLQDSIKMALDLLIIRANYTLGRWTLSH